MARFSGPHLDSQKSTGRGLEKDENDLECMTLQKLADSSKMSLTVNDCWKFA